MWLRRFLGIFWVDRCIMGQTPIDVASTFFWVDHQRFFRYFRRLGFQIDGVGFWSVALLMVCVQWPGLYWWFLIGGSNDRWHGFDGLCVCVCVWLYVCVCVALCVWWWVWIGWSVYYGSLCVALCVEPELEVKGEREAVGKPKKMWQSRLVWKKWQLEINSKERLKNNILIKMEFWDAGGIVKWYGISNKVTFWDGKIE